MQVNLKREVEELEAQTHVGGITTGAMAAQGGALAGGKGGPPAKSIVKLKAEKLEKSKALRLAQQVCHAAAACRCCCLYMLVLVDGSCMAKRDGG